MNEDLQAERARLNRIEAERRIAEARKTTTALLDHEEALSFLNEIDAFLVKQAADERAQWQEERRHREEMETYFKETEQFIEDTSRRAYTAPDAVAARKAEAHDRLVEIDNQLYEGIHRCESKRIYDQPMRASFDAAHPGGADGCTCRGHQLFRKDIQPGDPIEPDHKTMDMGREVRVLAARERLHEATAELARRGIPVPSFG